MAVLYDKFEKPKSIRVEDVSLSSTFGKFIAEPLERGFGHTLGNSLRRVLLSAIETPALVAFCMEGVAHEYMAIEGVMEDVTTIILNLKSALLRALPTDADPQAKLQRKLLKRIDVSAAELAAAGGKKIITLGDLVQDGYFEVVNPDLPIFTVTKPFNRLVELKVQFGRGYVPTERLIIIDRQPNDILIDAIYTPVTLVNYYVEATRVGQDTDFDCLILEVTTDGRVSPKEALSFASKILMKQLEVFEFLDSNDLVFEDLQHAVDTDHDELMQKLVLSINEIELSVRSTNCLNGANIETIGELVVMPEPKLLQFRNFGKKSLTEIKSKLSEMGLFLGMDLTRFGITADNVKDKIKQYNEAHPRGVSI